jgi:hypothetical protein
MIQNTRLRKNSADNLSTKEWPGDHGVGAAQNTRAGLRVWEVPTLWFREGVKSFLCRYVLGIDIPTARSRAYQSPGLTSVTPNLNLTAA